MYHIAMAGVSACPEQTTIPHQLCVEQVYLASGDLPHMHTASAANVCVVDITIIVPATAAVSQGAWPRHMQCRCMSFS